LTESLQLALSKERELNYSLQSELEQEREKIERALATLPQVASMEASLEDAKQQAAQDIAMLEQRANVRIASELFLQGECVCVSGGRGDTE
jgi:DsbC/DsbD-like thiol-disulfide interchange protein